MGYHHWTNEEGYIITTDPEKIDFDALHHFLSKESYWAQNIPKVVVKKGIQNALNFSLLSPQNRFIGYAKLITDKATVAYLADVYIEKKFRGRGLGKWLIQQIMNHPELQNLRLWLLHTQDAHDFYKKYGFSKPTNLENIMQIHSPASECYNNK